MVPDLHFYLPLPLSTNVTHSIPGVVGLDAVTGLVALAIWHLLLAEPLYTASPGILRGRLSRPDPRSMLRLHGWLRRLALTYLSVVIGAATHLGWDSFTHPGAWGAWHVGWLSTQHGHFYGAELAHFASTFAGGLILVVWTVRWWRRTPPRGPAKDADQQRGWWLVPMLGVVTVLTTVTNPLVKDHGSDVQHAVFDAVTTGVGLLLALTILLAAGWHVRRVYGRLAE